MFERIGVCDFLGAIAATIDQASRNEGSEEVISTGILSGQMESKSGPSTTGGGGCGLAVGAGSVGASRSRIRRKSTPDFTRSMAIGK